MSKKGTWQQLREDNFAELDIRSQYETWGVKFTGSVSSKGWAECYAISRDENNPSAGVNLHTGIYKDFAGEVLTIFDFAVKYGHAGNWQDAQEMLARAAGFAKRIPKKSKAKRPLEKIDLKQQLIYGTVLIMRKKLKVSFKTIEMTGAKNAQYPDKSPNPQTVVAFPIYDAEKLLEVPAESFVLECGDGDTVKVFQGKGLPYKQEKRIVLGTTGVLNKFALENLETAERVYKTEGVSDMLALQEKIPEELRTKHVVITNACGTDDSAPAWALVSHLAGKEVVIIHDRDIPGQFGTGADKSGGAQRWVRAMSGVAKSVKNVQLPYEMQEKHGKDLKDWIHEGHTYQDFLQLVADSPELKSVDDKKPETVEQDSPQQAIARRLNITVVGSRNDRNGNNNAVIYNISKNRLFFIRQVPKWTFTDAVQQLGDIAIAEINEDDAAAAGPKLSMRQVRNAIAYLASERVIDGDNTIGAGLWKVGQNLIAVGGGEWMTLNGILSVSTSFETKCRKFLIEMDPADRNWYDRKLIEKYMEPALDPAWRITEFERLVSILRRWDNYENGQIPEIIGSLMIASWAQTVWRWRPWVSITGPSNCGKTTLFRFLAEYFGSLTIFSSDVTYAGIRQEIGKASRMVLLDEFESNHERPKIIQWLKGSGAEAGGTAIRGTPGGRSTKSHVKIMPWMAATEAQMSDETERNRYIPIRLKSRTGMPMFEYPKPEEILEVRNRTLAILFRTWHRIEELHDLLCKRYKTEITTRYVESWALPCAVQAAIYGLSNDAAMEMFSAMMQPVEEELEVTMETEEQSLIDAIMGAKVHVGSGNTKLVAELLTSLSYQVTGSKESAEVHLERNGIKKLSDKALKGKKAIDEEYVFLYCSLITDNLLQRTKYAMKGIDQYLLRIPGAIRTAQKIMGRPFRGVAIPFSALKLSANTDDFVPDESAA